MTTIGRILVVPRGKYNSDTQYDKLDMVSYGGKGWVCKKICTGVLPSEGDYWSEIIDVSEALNDYMVTVDVTLDNVSITSDSTGDVSKDIASLVPIGYKAVDAHMKYSGNDWFYVTKISLDNNVLNMSIKNTYSDTKHGNPKAVLVCVREL